MDDLEPLRRAAVDLIANHAHLPTAAERAAIVLHGSMAMGFDDAYADVDLWMIVPSRAIATAVIAECGTGFFDLKGDGRPGHMNVVAFDELADRIARADLPLIADVRRAMPLIDRDGTASRLIDLARQPMSDATRERLALYHYVEMRSEHRSADNPINRNDAIPTLFAVAKTLTHALRMACVLDREPYPYDKWLAHAARRTPAGRAVMPLIDRTMDLIGQGAMALPGPEQAHPINTVLREVRSTLVTLARERDITGRWLDKWWLHLDESRGARQNVSWP